MTNLKVSALLLLLCLISLGTVSAQRSSVSSERSVNPTTINEPVVSDAKAHSVFGMTKAKMLNEIPYAQVDDLFLSEKDILSYVNIFEAATADKERSKEEAIQLIKGFVDEGKSWHLVALHDLTDIHLLNFEGNVDKDNFLKFLTLEVDLEKESGKHDFKTFFYVELDGTYKLLNIN